MSRELPDGDEFCHCRHEAKYHTWGAFEGGRVVNLPSKCRVVGCECAEFTPGVDPVLLEKKEDTERFYALQRAGITGDVANFLVDLAVRVRELEKRRI